MVMHCFILQSKNINRLQIFMIEYVNWKIGIINWKTGIIGFTIYIGLTLDARDCCLCPCMWCRYINVVGIAVYLISRISVGCCVAQCAPGGRQCTRWLYHWNSAGKLHLGSTSRVSVPLHSSVRTPCRCRQARETVRPVLHYRYLWDSWRSSLYTGDWNCN